MTSADSGIVTILFTDEVASTEADQRLGDDAADAVRRDRVTLLRRTHAAFGGHEVKTIGDSLMVVFASAVDALGCAVAMQRAVEADNEGRPPHERVSLRIGLDTGEPIRREDDYFGTPVVVARRLCDGALGGQIVASDLTRRLVGSRGQHDFQDLGSLTLKGIADPVVACEVGWCGPGAAARAPEPSRAALFPPWLQSEAQSPFVGRAAELARALAGFDRARAGRQTAVLIDGEAGIGKTRLAAQAALAAQRDGARVLFARCDPDHAPAGGIFEQPLLQLSANEPRTSPVASAARDALSALRRRDAAAADIAIATALHACAAATPLVIIIDDMHRATPADVATIRHVLSALLAACVQFLFTHRGGAAQTGTLAPLLAELRREGALERITLAGVSPADVGELIGTWSGSPCPPSLARAVHARTDGNPLFIGELLRHLAETEAIYERDGELTTALSVDELPIPEGLRELIEQRIALLSPDCVRSLTAAAVIGNEFDLASLERATEIADDRLVQLMEEAAWSGTVREASEDRYVFAHALIREALYEGVTATRRARVHRQALKLADSASVRIAFEELGSGSGLHIVATGISNCPAVRMRSLIAARRWERASRDRSVVLYDRRGIGSSDAPERGYSLRSTIEDLRAVLDAARVPRAVLWGGADGGPVAIAFAAAHPERVAGLILSGTSARLQNGDGWELGITAEAMAGLDQSDQSRTALQLTNVRRTVQQDARAISDVLRRVPRPVWTKIRLCIGSSDVRALLDGLRLPVLILHDEGNRYIPVGAAHFLHEHIAGSTLVLTDDLAAPLLGDEVYSAVDAFVDSIAGESR